MRGSSTLKTKEMKKPHVPVNEEELLKVIHLIYPNMNKAQETRNANGNFRLGWYLMENHIEPEDLLDFTVGELQQVKSIADERLAKHIDELLWNPAKST